MAITYPFADVPAPGNAHAVVPGVQWLRMPLPFALDHINLWLLDDGEGYTAVDTGIALDDVKTAWKSALAGCNAPQRVRRLTRQIVTHFHPDHLGLAAWLEQETGAPLWMTQGEYMTAHLVAGGIAPFDIPSMLALFRRHGLSETGLAGLERRGNAYRRGVPAIPTTFQPLRDGDELAIGAHPWRILIGHGHAPEHASLYCEELGILIGGDMMLPRISTNVSAFAAAPENDPLALFLASLDVLKTLPADTLVLPSHGRPFHGLLERIAELEQHHADRCAELLAACTEAPRSAGDLLTVLFGRPIEDPHQTMFAMGEAIAHLIYLERRHQLIRQETNGVCRFALPSQVGKHR